MNPDQEFIISPGITYIHKKDHRNDSPEKAQWIISEIEERECYRLGIEKSWSTSPDVSWGIHINAGKAAYLGRTASKKGDIRESFIAKFRDDEGNNCWHGYPADPREDQDIPPVEILRDWEMNKYLRLATIRKIIKKQKCKL
ncbi:MAG: hypothetical protein ACO37W_10035 [Prochlorotrichaceae cyanobacterium]